jgi:hypothetical protein
MRGLCEFSAVLALHCIALHYHCIEGVGGHWHQKEFCGTHQQRSTSHQNRRHHEDCILYLHYGSLRNWLSTISYLVSDCI